MERAGKLISRLPLPGGCLPPEDLVRSAWPQTVGKRIAARAHVVQLRGSTLVVEVEDSIWQSQLWTLRGHILSKLKQVLGREIATEIEFPLRIPRREPQRAESRQANTVAEDEADRIADPMFRRLYKTARRKSSA